MLSIYLFGLQFLLDITKAAAPTCVSRHAFLEHGFTACSDKSATSGTCCPNGKACLDSGLCFGRDRVLSRSSCDDSWNAATCLTFCEDMLPLWTQIAPCRAWIRDPVSNYYWCATNAETSCRGANDSFIQFSTGGVKAIPGPVEIVDKTAPVLPPIPTDNLKSSIKTSQPANSMQEASIIPDEGTANHIPLISHKSSHNRTMTASRAGIYSLIVVLVIAILGRSFYEKIWRRRMKEMLFDKGHLV